MVPVQARIGELHPAGEVTADGDRLLGLVGAVGAVFEPQAMPVDGRLEVALVVDVDLDFRPLGDAERWAGDRPVVAEHPNRVIPQPLAHWADLESKLGVLAEFDGLTRDGVGETSCVGRKEVGHLRSPALVVKVGADDDLDGDDRGDREVDHEAERRPPPRVGDELTAVLPRVLQPVAGKAEHQQPRRARHGGGSNHHEHRSNATFNGDDSCTAIGNSEPDVDGGNRGEAEGVDRRLVEPPEGKRRCRLPYAEDESPRYRGSQ